MISIRNVCLACVLAAASSGCVVYQSGEKIDPNLVSRIHKKETSRNEVEALFGPPMRVEIIYVGQVGDRLLQYTYREILDRNYPFSTNPGTLTRRQKLLVWTGPDNLVKDFEFTDYLTDRSIQGVTEVVKRAAVPTHPTTGPTIWYPGGED